MTNQEAIKMLTAKVECIRRETSGTDIDCNLRNCDDCELCYAQGITGEQRKALNMAISALQALDEIYAFIMKSEASETTDGVLEIFDALEAEELKQEATHSTELSLTQNGLDTISRQAAIDAIVAWAKDHNEMPDGDDCIMIIGDLPSAQPDLGKYEYHYDHTDCIWYRPEARNRCPVTCAQYRDGWNDAMNYIFRDGKGYRPYRRGEQYEE